jgi:hypothetical protein
VSIVRGMLLWSVNESLRQRGVCDWGLEPGVIGAEPLEYNWGQPSYLHTAFVAEGHADYCAVPLCCRRREGAPSVPPPGQVHLQYYANPPNYPLKSRGPALWTV